MRVLSNTRTHEGSPVRGGQFAGAVVHVGHFMRHLLEMCVVMCVGVGLLGLLFFGSAALLGFSDLKQTAPELTILVIAVILATSMATWMRFRGMEWQPTLEMAGSSLVVGLLMVAASWLGLASTNALIGVECAVACVAMLAVMLYRARLYSGVTTHHVRAR